MSGALATEPLCVEDVWQIVEDVWESLLGEPALQAEHAFGLDGGTLTGSVELRGDWNGVVTVTLPQSAAHAVTRAMLGVDAGAELAAADVQDAVGELVNVIGGNVKALTTGATRLGLPAVGVGILPPPGQLVCRTGVEWSGQVARIGVWHGVPAQSSEGGAR